MSLVKGDTRQTGKEAESQTTNHPYWFIASFLSYCHAPQIKRENR